MVLPAQREKAAGQGTVSKEPHPTKIGLIKPVQMLLALSQDAALGQVAKEVEEKTIQMVEDAK